MTIRQTLLKTVDMETDIKTITAIEMCSTWHRKGHTGDYWEVSMHVCN
jgi:hypothetical protein